jgi:hypothetical protein
MTDLETEITFKALSSLGYGGSFRETLDSFRLDNGDALTSDQRQLLDEEITRLQAEYDAQDYARNRLTEYPTIEECVHAILDDDLDALQVLRQAVKDKYPK